MLAFFRLNDPYRLLILLIFLILMKLPAFYGSVPLTEPELKWMLVGEKLAENGAVMYEDVWDDTAPLAAGLYWLLHELFGRSQLTYQIIALVLIVFQCALFNYLLLRNKAYNENTYVPAFVYGLLMCTFFQFYTLSPALISLTFILLAINNVFFDIEHKTANDTLLSTGILMGLASLFYLPSVVVVFALLFAYLLFTGTTPKSYFLFLYGLALPWLLVGVYFYWNNALFEFYHNYLYAMFLLEHSSYMDYGLLIFIAGVPLLFLIASFVKLFEAKRFTNFQERFQQTMFFVFLMALVSWWISNNRMPALLVLFVPVGAFYISHFFLLMRRRFIAEIVFTLFFLTILFIHFSSLYQWGIISPYLSNDKLLVHATKYDEIVADKKILYIGEDISVYKNASLATPYLNWKLSSLHLTEPEYYDNIVAIHDHFKKDQPEIIIDDVGVMDELWYRMPSLASQYKKGNEDQVYVKVD